MHWKKSSGRRTGNSDSRGTGAGTEKQDNASEVSWVERVIGGFGFGQREGMVTPTGGIQAEGQQLDDDRGTAYFGDPAVSKGGRRVESVSNRACRFATPFSTLSTRDLT